jgi:hypothetical protein
MGSIIDLLALLDGWDYRELADTITVAPGVVNEVFAERVVGWLLFANYEATDAFANITVNMPPETFPVVSTNLADLATVGLTIPISTAFIVTAFNFTGLPLDSSGFGAASFNLPYPLPLKKENTVHIDFTLDPGTTQANASITYTVIMAQIYKPKEFQQSLKDLLNVKKLPAIF